MSRRLWHPWFCTRSFPGLPYTCFLLWRVGLCIRDLLPRIGFEGPTLVRFHVIKKKCLKPYRHWKIMYYFIGMGGGSGQQFSRNMHLVGLCRWGSLVCIAFFAQINLVATFCLSFNFHLYILNILWFSLLHYLFSYFWLEIWTVHFYHHYAILYNGEVYAYVISPLCALYC